MKIIRENDPKFDELMKSFQKIIMDRSIPEANKVLVKKQMDELIRLKTITEQFKIVVTDEEFERWCKS